MTHSGQRSRPRSANERPGAPGRTKRTRQKLAFTCFPSELCIRKPERGASESERRHRLTEMIPLLSSLNDVCAVVRPVRKTPRGTDGRVLDLDVTLMRFSGGSGSPLCSLLLMCFWPTAAVGSAAPDHPGICPNHINLNLWVDAQSTCERECQTDQVNQHTHSLITRT